MGVRVSGWADLGDGTVRVFGRTDAGNSVDIVIGRHRFDTADMRGALEVAGRKVDMYARALQARAGRSDQEE